MAEGKIRIAGEFEISVCKLNLINGEEIDLLTNETPLIQLKLREGIMFSGIVGQLLFGDSMNIKSMGPIIGQETLLLKMQTTKGFDEETASWDFTVNNLAVTKIVASKDLSDVHNATMIEFVSQELKENYRMRLSQTYEGEISKIVETILKKDLNSGKNLFIEPTIGKKKFIAPNMCPFDVINLLKRQAISENKEPTYHFWESTNGYHFRTLDSMYGENNPIMKYEPAGASHPGDVMETISSLLVYEILGHGDITDGFEFGCFSSKLIEHDIYNKTYTTHEYDYLDPKSLDVKMAAGEYGGEGNPIYSESPINSKGDTLTKKKEKVFLFPTALKDRKLKTDATYSTGVGGGNAPKYNYTAKNAGDWYQRRNMISSMFDEETSMAPTLEISVHGNSIVNAGDLIMIDIPGNENHPIDMIYNGPFLVQTIDHNFLLTSKKHSMSMIVSKDSLKEKLPSNYIKYGKGSGRVIKSYYTDGF